MIRDVELFDRLPSTLHRLVRERLVPAEERVAEEDCASPRDCRRDLQSRPVRDDYPRGIQRPGLSMEEEVGAVFELGWTSPAFRSLIDQQWHRQPGTSSDP